MHCRLRGGAGEGRGEGLKHEAERAGEAREVAVLAPPLRQGADGGRVVGADEEVGAGGGEGVHSIEGDEDGDKF